MVIFDNVLTQWENELFHRCTMAATFIRATLHRYSVFAFVQRNLKVADMLIGAALFDVSQTGLDKYYTLNGEWVAEDRRKLLASARDLISSDYGGHRLAFQMFAQSPKFAQVQAVYRNFYWNGPLDFVKKFAGLSDSVRPTSSQPVGDHAVTRYFSANDNAKMAAE